jgi:hypothetical protein
MNKNFFSFFHSFLLLPALSAFLLACSPQSIDEFQEEGEGIVRSLIHELQEISTQEELLAAAGQLQSYFNRLVSVMIAAEEHLKAFPQEKGSVSAPWNRELNEQLRLELHRIYKIKGGKQLIEKTQEKALHRLDIYMKKNLSS